MSPLILAEYIALAMSAVALGWWIGWQVFLFGRVQWFAHLASLAATPRDETPKKPALKWRKLSLKRRVKA